MTAPAHEPREPRSERRADYGFMLAVPTRWMDNDLYGHVNNVVYYAYFDTVINRWLIDEGKLDIHEGAIVGLCVESQCRYLAPTAFPDVLDACVRVGHLGRSSVRYEIAIFRAGEEPPAAVGSFVHVFVDRATRRPAPIPDGVRAALARLESKRP